MDWLQILPVLGLGSLIGGVIGAFFQSKFQHQKQLKEWEHEVKRKRYFALNVLLITKIDVPSRIASLSNIRPDINTEEQMDKEIEVELLNAILFASDNVLKEIKDFIAKPSTLSYHNVAMAMRRDLWKKQTSVALHNTFPMRWPKMIDLD